MKCPHCQTDIDNRGNCPWGCDVDALPQNASVDSRSQHDPSPVGRTRTTEHERKLAEATKQRDELVNALIDCREDSVELLGERHWWKDEPRLKLQARYEETAENVRKADAALAAVKGGEG